MIRSSVYGAAAALTLVSVAQGQTATTSSTPPPASTPAPAQTTPPPAKAAPVKSLTVTGKTPDYRRDADRRSYSIAGDLNAAHGSIADALRDIPSVDVDLQGNVSLRGDSNVTILVDGQPSALFKGPNKGDLLQQLPADQYDRVEVMTNPSAAFSPEGTAGIINLITKKAHPAPFTGTLSATGATTGTARVSASGAYGLGKWGLIGTLGGSTNAFDQDSATTGQITDPTSGESAQISSVSHVRGASNNASAGGQVSYAIDRDARLTEGLQVVGGDSLIDYDGTYRSSAASGVLAQDYDTTGRSKTLFSALFSNTGYRRTFGSDDKVLTANLTINSFGYTSTRQETLSYLTPAQPNLFQDLATGFARSGVDLKTEYHTPAPDKAKLVVGYELQFEQSQQRHSGALGTDAGDADFDPALTDDFVADQTVNSLYATYNQPFGKLQVQPGLRLEDVVLDTHQRTLQLRNDSGYFQAYPTLHIAYALDSFTQLTASFSRRVDRPDLQELDPFRVYNSPLSFSQGNPTLKPSITDSYELGYEVNGKSGYWLFSLYYKDKGDIVFPVTENLGGGVLLSSYANVGHDNNLGAELTTNGHFTKTLSYSATLNVDWDDLNDPAVVIGGSRSGTLVSAKAKLNWTPTPNDFVQVDVHARSQQVTAQGFETGLAYLNFGYRHRLTDRWTAEVRVTDAFDSTHSASVTDTPTLQQRTVTEPHNRAAYFTLSYALGKVAPRQQARDFDFDSGGAGGAPGAPH